MVVAADLRVLVSREERLQGQMVRRWPGWVRQRLGVPRRRRDAGRALAPLRIAGLGGFLLRIGHGVSSTGKGVWPRHLRHVPAPARISTRCNRSYDLREPTLAHQR